MCRFLGSLTFGTEKEIWRAVLIWDLMIWLGVAKLNFTYWRSSASMVAPSHFGSKSVKQNKQTKTKIKCGRNKYKGTQIDETNQANEKNEQIKACMCVSQIIIWEFSISKTMNGDFFGMFDSMLGGFYCWHAAKRLWWKRVKRKRKHTEEFVTDRQNTIAQPTNLSICVKKTHNKTK